MALAMEIRGYYMDLYDLVFDRNLDDNRLSNTNLVDKDSG